MDGLLLQLGEVDGVGVVQHVAHDVLDPLVGAILLSSLSFFHLSPPSFL